MDRTRVVDSIEDYGDARSNYSNPMTWHHIPSEILVMIMKKLPKSERAAMSRVCQSWREVIHSEASRILKSIVQANLVEDCQLASLGFDISDQRHDVNACSCIDMVYSKTPFSLSTFQGKGIKVSS